MAISFVDKTSVANSTATTAITNNVPIGVVANDLLLWAVEIQTAATIATPTGWSVWQATLSGTALSYAGFYKWASGSEPASYSVTVSSIRNAGTMLAYRGVDTTTPFDVANPAAVTGTTTQVAMPSITTVTANAWVVAVRFAATAASTSTVVYTSAAGNLRDSNTTTAAAAVNVGDGVADYARPTAGAFTADLTNAIATTQNRAFVSALRPAAVTAPARNLRMIGNRR